MNQRLKNELIIRLAKRALFIIAPCLREEERRDAFDEFCSAFGEELAWYETQADRMNKRLGRTEQE
jgi:hypothetical protein